jgi:VIT1/CCC1 family predicted Fe2+/Mn2+ transporter
MAHRYLSFTDRTGEIAFAVLMVIIINGYVALSDLNTGFVYIVAVNIGACFGWGFIDGFVYAISSSIDRNRMRNKLALLKKIASEKKEPTQQCLTAEVEKTMDGTVFESYSKEGKEVIAKEIVAYAPQATVPKNKLLTKDEALGWLSIISIYMVVGFLMALPFLILPDKFVAWLFSNTLGVVWLFWYGVQLGKSLGRCRLLLGFSMSSVGVIFLVLSYIIWT